MLRVFLIGFLSLAMLCMIPMMGSTPHHSGHLHHDDAASCATCMASVDVTLNLLPFNLLGLAILAFPVPPKLLPPGSPFPPPRFRS